MPLSADDRQRRRETALAIIQQKPGITHDRFAIAIGIKLRDQNRRGGTNPEVFRFIRSLKSEDGIQVEKVADMPIYKLYPADWEPPKKRPLFQPAHTAASQCKVFRVPLDQLEQYTKPTEPAKPLHLKRLVPQKPSSVVENEELDMSDRKPPRSTAELRQAVIDAIDHLAAQGKPFQYKDVLRTAQCSGNVWSRYPDLKERAKLAIAKLRGQETAALLNPPTPQPQPPTPNPQSPTPDPYVEKLKAEVARLQTEKALLEQQVNSRNESHLTWLRQQRNEFGASLQRLEAELQQLLADQRAVRANCEAIDRLIELEQARIETKAESNGHYRGVAIGVGGGAS